MALSGMGSGQSFLSSCPRGHGADPGDLIKEQTLSRVPVIGQRHQTDYSVETEIRQHFLKAGIISQRDLAFVQTVVLSPQAIYLPSPAIPP